MSTTPGVASPTKAAGTSLPPASAKKAKKKEKAPQGLSGDSTLESLGGRKAKDPSRVRKADAQPEGDKHISKKAAVETKGAAAKGAAAKEPEALTKQDIEDLDFVLNGLNKETTEGMTGYAGVLAHLAMDGAGYILRSDQRQRLHEGGKAFHILKHVLRSETHTRNMRRIVSTYGEHIVPKLDPMLKVSVAKLQSEGTFDQHVTDICEEHDHLKEKMVRGHLKLALKEDTGSFLNLARYALKCPKSD
ncbi:MAG: hypothetical protein S4CHLAM37_05790 [Chlamydiia bacterium]|nr:hypothetical protein [Chlamydiia bacterium]